MRAHKCTMVRGSRKSVRTTESPSANLRVCEHPGCAEAGEFRAPRSRENLNQYRWFCLEHVREYNSKWDFYAGMSEDEILRDFPYLTREDIRAALAFAADRERRISLAAAE